MQRETMSDLVAFLAVARERSFTRAAAKLGVSPSALSHTVRKLEERLGVRLLTRTSRSVSTTEPGQRLLERVGPHFDQVAAQGVDVGLEAACGSSRDRMDRAHGDDLSVTDAAAHHDGQLVGVGDAVEQACLWPVVIDVPGHAFNAFGDRLRVGRHRLRREGSQSEGGDSRKGDLEQRGIPCVR